MSNDGMSTQQRRKNARRMAFVLMLLALLFYAGIFVMTALYR